MSQQGGRVRRMAAMTAAVALASVTATALSGQTQTPPPTGQTGQAAQGQQTPQDPSSAQFRTEVNLVTLDVMVHDQRGQFMADLKVDDFVVLEDGVPQKVDKMVLWHGGRPFTIEDAPPANVPEGMILPPARPIADTAGRIFLIFIDDLHLRATDTPQVRHRLRQMADTLVHDGDLFAIVSTGYSSIEVSLTYDRSRLTEAINKVMGSGMTSHDLTSALSSAGNQGPQEVRYRAHVAFDTAYRIIEQMKKINDRRKAFVYFSSGYHFNPFEESRLKLEYERYATYDESGNITGNPFDNPMARMGDQFAETDLVAEIAELTRAANRANATIYTVDPRGLMAGPDINENVTHEEWIDYKRVTLDSIKVLASETGGFCICDTNFFLEGFQRIDAETSDYYILQYYSSNPDPLRRVRKIDVQVKRDDAQVRTRSEYALPIPSGGGR